MKREITTASGIPARFVRNPAFRILFGAGQLPPVTAFTGIITDGRHTGPQIAVGCIVMKHEPAHHLFLQTDDA